MREGWEVKKLNTVVVDYHQGLNTAGQKIKFVDVGYPIIQTRNLDNGKIDLTKKIKFMSTVDWNLYKDKYRPQIGNVFLTNIGTIGKTAVVTEENNYLIHWNIFIFKLDENILSSFYLKYFLDCPSSFDYYQSFQKGGTVNFITKKMIGNLEILLPPLPEQKKIVSTLDKAFKQLDQAKANLEKNLHNAKELVVSYLQKKFLNNISGQESVTLNSICELIVDCEHKTAPIENEGYPSIRTPNIGFGTLLLDKVNRVSEETYKEWTRRAIPQEDDLILAREAPAGNIAVIPKRVQVCLGQRTVLLRPKKDIIIAKYLAFIILSKDVQEELLSHSKGATVGHINMKDIRAFKLYNLPSLAEQKRIVNDIDNIYIQTKKLQTHYQQKLNNLEELKKSILQKAFRGEL